MPQSKSKSKANKKTAVKKDAGKRLSPSSEIKKGSDGQQHFDFNSSHYRTFNKVFPWVLIGLSVFILFCYAAEGWTGIFGKALRYIEFSFFGGAAYILPILMLISGICWHKDVKNGKHIKRTVFESLFLIFFSAMIHKWTSGSADFNIGAFWTDGGAKVGGGFVGGIVCVALMSLTGSVGTYIIGITGIVVFGLFSVGLTPYSIYIRIAYALKIAKERRDARIAEEEELLAAEQARRQEPEEEISDKRRREKTGKKRRVFDPDIEVDDATESGKSSELNIYGNDSGEGDLFKGDEKEGPVDAEKNDMFNIGCDDGVPPFDGAVKTAGAETLKPVGGSKVTKRPDIPVSDGEEAVNLSEIFTDPDGVDVLQRFAEEHKNKELSKSRVSEESELEIVRSALEEKYQLQNTVPEEPKEYEFPPINLLKLDNSPKNVDISEELRSNAAKLVETLRSFKVRTRIVNVSRGPSITRYELVPEEGVRVRAIANLVDDISLSLATSGVRIEAPIPGKAAVGIEVPNKNVSTVFIRDLVDSDAFRNAKSKLNVSLGKDVAGTSMFLDIAKMPHLLIAGATGMGKSVCINSMITSLLYKGSPEEVKLILIDPKKVELNIYNGLPHLLVPVVSDPKKAAGALHWAVTEMERRFEVIEEAGVRDIASYNSVTADEPEREKMPQIVIIIDELADLMMTAPDDVEASICRLAQKARAAGMHLVIGTQRPSVDVITGLIKANIPSRIAFTVASQADSRVVLDIAGAEKLIGRGDMLYAPVGASKPVRVQGAFVSESEVEAIVSYIKERNTAKTSYSSEIIESIDKAAAACGSKKGNPLAPDTDSSEGGDSMLRSAIELAVESGKISTSLIQRRLSLGYGRAAKLIDEMERRGIVSGPEGQKPRTVLITKEQYMEMVVNSSEDLE